MKSFYTTALGSLVALVALVELITPLGFAGADDPGTVETRLNELENKVLALETGIKEKLGQCQLIYKHFTYRLNRCDAGTFTRSVTPVGNGMVQLECGYYQLRCQNESEKTKSRDP